MKNKRQLYRLTSSSVAQSVRKEALVHMADSRGTEEKGALEEPPKWNPSDSTGIPGMRGAGLWGRVNSTGFSSHSMQMKLGTMGRLDLHTSSPDLGGGALAGLKCTWKEEYCTKTAGKGASSPSGCNVTASSGGSVETFPKTACFLMVVTWVVPCPRPPHQ